MLDIPPEELLHSRDTVKRFDKILESVNPDVIYTHWNSDSHQDHNAVSMATIGATRANRCAVLMYEQTIPGGIVPWGFRAQSYVDISAWMPIKMESIATHKSQVRANGDLWVQGVRGRAMYRGLPDERRVRRGLRGHQGRRRLLQGLEAAAPRPRSGRRVAASLQTLPTSPDTPRTMFDKIRRLTGHVLVYGFGNIGNRVVGFLLIPVYSRYLTPEDYGVLALVAMLGQILYSVMNMGQNSALFRTYFRHESADERETGRHHLALAHPDAVAADRPPGPRAVQANLVAPRRQSRLHRVGRPGHPGRGCSKCSCACLWPSCAPASNRDATPCRASCRPSSALVLAIIFVVGLHLGGRGVLLSQLVAELALCLFLFPATLRGMRLLVFSRRDASDLLTYGSPSFPARS